MTEMIIKDLDKWIAQNQAEIVDVKDGCLLDNFMMFCKRGMAYIFEEYVNEWTSQYHAYWIKYGANRPNVNAVYERWDALQSE